MRATIDRAPVRPAARSSRHRPMLLVAAVLVLALVCLLSLAIGSRLLPLGRVLAAFGRHDQDAEAVVVGLRLPRTLFGVAGGVALGLSGALMQALTRNPLADPGFLGVTAGASFATVFAVGVAGITSIYGYVWFAFAGALLASVVVYVLGNLGQGRATPVKLVMAGVVVTALLSSLASALALLNPSALNRFRFWSAGSLTGQQPALLVRVLPFLVAGLVLAIAVAPALNGLALGDDVAASLGRRPGRIRLQGAIAVTLLVGATVAVIGPIAFVGLVVPHLARRFGGADQRWLLVFSAVLGPVLLLVADIAGRIVARPQEIQAGIVVAFLGAPFFIALVRRRKLAEL
jgi:iron complex transport system permease protein